MSDTTTTTEAREELSRRVNGAVEMSFGEAVSYLESDDAADLLEAAGWADESPERVIKRVTGYQM